MSKSDAWMPLYVGDYLRDTGHLTATEHGAFLLLLMQAWSRGGALPADEDRLRAMARLDRREWAKVRDAVLAFFVREGDTLRNPRLDREISRAKSVSSERSKAGAAGAAKRWSKAETSEANAIAIATDLPWQNDAQSQSQSQSQKKETPSPPSVVRPPRGSRLPADWQPDANLVAFARSLNLDAARIAAQFRDYWHAKAGKDAAKLDWAATWRGWCRREAERRPQARTSGQTRWDAQREAFEDMGLFTTEPAPLEPFDIDSIAETLP